MAIPVHQEPGAWSTWDAEECCFCHDLSVHWTSLPDRKPGEQVACCPACAVIFDPDVVPTKREWVDYHRSLLRR